MITAWYQKEPNLAASLREELEKKYPDLQLSITGSNGTLRGSFPVIYEGVELDRLQIEVHIPEGFPAEIPSVQETMGRIPRDVDWHTFSDGHLCVIVPEEWLLNPNSNSLIAYLDGPLRNFFIGHALAEAGQQRAMGERSHGIKGLLESYGEMVGSTDPKAIANYLDYCASKKLKSHWKCPCGSGKRVKICHLGHMITLRRKIPRWIAKKAHDRLMTLVRHTSKLSSAEKPGVSH